LALGTGGPSARGWNLVRSPAKLPTRVAREGGLVMNIALVGGVEHQAVTLEHVAKRAGHRLEYHGGHMGGRGASILRAAIERADIVVLQTAVNSHGSMYFAKRLARQLGKTLVIVRTFGPARFESLLESWQESATPKGLDLVDCCG